MNSNEERMILMFILNFVLVCIIVSIIDDYRKGHKESELSFIKYALKYYWVMFKNVFKMRHHLKH